MARECYFCNKKTVSGGSRRHNPGKAGGVSGPWAYKAQRTLRNWKPNLRKVTVVNPEGSKLKVKTCMRCYKTLKKS